ncbi:hypothetical protein EK904_006910 [Melospiza melodia maxima]|nr:hypothetical protein EK904_006910 [Melospiza melodia maxima]
MLVIQVSFLPPVPVNVSSQIQILLPPQVPLWFSKKVKVQVTLQVPVCCMASKQPLKVQITISKEKSLTIRKPLKEWKP